MQLSMPLPTALRQRLTGQHNVEADTLTRHKLYYGPTAAPYGISVDLVPFGALSGEREEIRWPPQMASRWGLRFVRIGQHVGRCDAMRGEAPPISLDG
ncbi:hypothetical protein RBA41_27520 [Massilia sp. CCM 9210]|uniref:hypothetical protein n=1 Tax=Massilia scottii TaxID=3057166 RepID=UPI002796D195|nr:hypothetical protein [Massilia sp. CCM 9210]MDQ1817061.1 hypothetical protein [Massilia sp. CCM 9210]